MSLDIVNLTTEEISAIAKEVEQELLSKPKIPFKFIPKWYSQFPNKAGLYCIFDKGELFYIGETAKLRERMAEVHRTYNHSARRILGKRDYPNSKIVKGKFVPQNGIDIELELNNHFVNHLSFSFVEVSFGRLELESYLIHRNKDKLLQKVGKRNRIE